MRLSKTAEFIVFNILASFGISLSISFFMTVLTNGFVVDFMPLWGKSFVLGYIIAVPSSMIVIPIVNRIMTRITNEI